MGARKDWSDDESEGDEPPSRDQIKNTSFWTVQNALQPKMSSVRPSTSTLLPEIDQSAKKRKKRAKLHVRGVGTKSAMARLKREIKIIQNRITKGGPGLHVALKENMEKALRGKQHELNVLFIES